MYEKLQTLLRCTKNENDLCQSCLYIVRDKNGEFDYCNTEALELDAASAIEALTADNTAKDAEIEQLKADLARVTASNTKIVNDAEHWKQKHNAMAVELDHMTAERDAAVSRNNAAYKIAWGCDIPSPTIPEYVELHDGMTRVMAALCGPKEGD